MLGKLSMSSLMLVFTFIIGEVIVAADLDPGTEKFLIPGRTRMSLQFVHPRFDSDAPAGDSNDAEDNCEAKVLDDIRVKGQVVVPAGSIIQGVVLNRNDSSAGTLSLISLEQIQFPNNERTDFFVEISNCKSFQLMRGDKCIVLRTKSAKNTEIRGEVSSKQYADLGLKFPSRRRYFKGPLSILPGDMLTFTLSKELMLIKYRQSHSL